MHGQWEDDARLLHLLVGGEIKEEIVEELVHGLWRRCLHEQLLEGVHRQGVDGIGYGVFRRLFHPLRLFSRTGERQQHTCEKRTKNLSHLRHVVFVFLGISLNMPQNYKIF